MLRLIGMITVVYLLFYFGIVQVLAIWGMAVLAMVAGV
jgi:hypothetical protein